MATSGIDLTIEDGPPIKKANADDVNNGNVEDKNSDEIPGMQGGRKRGRGGKQNRNNGNPNNENGDPDGPQNNGWQHQRGWSSTTFIQKLRDLSDEPSLDLPPIEFSETKFNGRCRLYVGNLASKNAVADLREMFKPYGEIDDIFCNVEKNFSFLRMDYYDNAVKAKRALDGTVHKGRTIRVSFAPNATAVHVSNLNQFVSNELLHKSFEIFGPIERAVIKVDDRGKHLGEGFVEFALKSSAKMCLRVCQEKCFFLTASLRPCFVEPMEITDNTEGLSELSLNKKLPDYIAERSVGPRFADIDSFEHCYGSRWKALHSRYKMKQEELKRELKKEEDKLDAQIELLRHERDTERLREELRQREIMQERRKHFWEMHEKRMDEANIRDYHHMSIRTGREDNGLPRPFQDVMDHGIRGGDYHGHNHRNHNKGLIARQDNEMYRHEMQERLIRQGDAMQRYQKDFEHGNQFFNSTPFKVFERNTNESADVIINSEKNPTGDNIILDERIEVGQRIF